MEQRVDALQQRTGYRFSDARLLDRALTHRSFGADHNERLEFLGDAVLSLVISSLLFDRFAGSDEGDLTRVRAHLVREDSLHRMALQLGLPDMLRLGEGEARGGGAQRASILADALEALIGATFQDGGFEAARGVVQRLFGEDHRNHRPRQLEQGREDRAAGMAAGAPPPGAELPHQRHPRPGPRPDLRGRVLGAGAELSPNPAKAGRGAPPSRKPRAACSTR